MKDDSLPRNLREYIQALSVDDPLPEEVATALADLPPKERRRRARLWHMLRALNQPGPNQVASKGAATPSRSTTESETVSDDEAWAQLRAQIRTGDGSEGADLQSMPLHGARSREEDSRSSLDRSSRPARRSRRSTPGTRRRIRWGVSALAALTIVLLLYVWTTPVRVEAPVQQHVVHELPDGSTVTLASGSMLEYPRGFYTWPFVDAASRQVTLGGEAFFDVVSEERSFVVATFNAQVDVLGTRFNVRARQDEHVSSTRVTLLEGRVRVGARTGDEAQLLVSPGDATVVLDTAPPSPVERVDPDRAAAWRNGGFNAVDLPLGSVLRDVERRFGRRIETGPGVDRAALMTLHYSAVQDAKAIIHDLCLSEGLQFRAINGGFKIFHPDVDARQEHAPEG